MELISRSDYIAHHGIKGQKWGVRRFQNKDGTLTRAGLKRKNVLEKAAKHAKDEVEYHKDMKKHYSKPVKDLYYSGPDGYKNWLNDNYGDDWKDPEYMKNVFEVTDVKKHALEEIAREKRMEQMESRNMVNYYSEGQKRWEAKVNFYSTVPVSDISGKDYRLAKKYAKRYDKDTLP